MPAGVSAAAAMLLAGFRRPARPRSTAARAPYCLMGICFDCLAEIDGVPNRQSCMVEARPGMASAARSGSAGNRSGPAVSIDLAVIGAGPAGMAAAALAAELGLETVLIDEQDSPGGQIYRGIERRGRIRRSETIISPAAISPRRCAPAASTTGRPRRSGTSIPTARCPSISTAGETLRPARILLATGAIERPVPIPGWTLPGVMTAGAAQILLKSADLVPEGRAVLAGQGPLLWLVAAQLPRRRTAVRCSRPRLENYLAAARLLPVWPARRLLSKGFGLIFAVRRAGIPVRRGVTGLRAIGRAPRACRLGRRRACRRSSAAA